MNPEELNHLIFSNEGPKMDYKKQPWDLENNGGKGEFVKDMLAMTNSFGDIGYIILGVGDEPDRPLASIEAFGISEERLQQIIKSYIEPPIEFNYESLSLHGNTVGIISIPISKSKPHWAKKPIGGVRDFTFFTRRGSTTDLATLVEIEQMIRDRPASHEGVYGGWNVELLRNRKEHIRLIPCIFLEKWDKEQSTVMSTDEIRQAIKERTGIQMDAQGAGNLVGSFNQKAHIKGLPVLFEQIDMKLWRLPNRYIDLFREFCG